MVCFTSNLEVMTRVEHNRMKILEGGMKPKEGIQTQ